MERDLGAKTRGRPRSFDAEAALEAALRVFWQSGYEGTTLPDLTAAMGINRPSLYAAFGNKEALFHKAVERYTQRTNSVTDAALSAPTAREATARLLRIVASGENLPTSGAPKAARLKGRASKRDPPKGLPKGCMIVQSALVCGAAAESIRQQLIAQRNATEATLRTRFERAPAAELPPATTPAGMAKFVITLMHGLAVQSASGATGAALLEAVEIAMRAWPKPA